MSPILNSPVAAAQFIFRAPVPVVPGISITQIASRLYEVKWLVLADDATEVRYTPNGERLTSRLAGELADFIKAIPFP